MARAGRVVAETLALIGEHIRPGVDDRRARRARRGVHPLAGRRPDLQGLPRLPGRDLHLAERHGRPRDPRPVRARRRRHPLRRRRRHARRLRRRLRVHVPGRRDLARRRAAARGLPGGARGRDRAVPRRATGSRTSRTRSRRRPRRRASRSCAASSATASAGRCTRTRRSRTTASRAAGPLLAAGMTFAIEPMINAGGPDIVRPRRRVVDLDRRRLAFGPFRAHRRGHRRAGRAS